MNFLKKAALAVFLFAIISVGAWLGHEKVNPNFELVNYNE